MNPATNVQGRRSSLACSDAYAGRLLVLPALLLALMVGTLRSSVPLYLVGQVAGALLFTQAQILLHEFGHSSMFKGRKLNVVLGHLCAFVVLIPRRNWVQVHELHHKWAGYRDKDPTTEDTYAETLSPRLGALVNFCWKYYIPLFTLAYRFRIYWNRPKLKRHLSPAHYSQCLRSMGVHLVLYGALLIAFPGVILSLLPAFYISLILCEIMTLSQHSHIAMLHSKGESVRPLKLLDQARFSRSLVVPPAIGKYLLFNFNLHEAHHAYPGLPCYRLPSMRVPSGNAFALVPWLKRVRSMAGIDFIFRTDANGIRF